MQNGCTAYSSNEKFRVWSKYCVSAILNQQITIALSRCDPMLSHPHRTLFVLVHQLGTTGPLWYYRKRMLARSHFSTNQFQHASAFQANLHNHIQLYSKINVQINQEISYRYVISAAISVPHKSVTSVVPASTKVSPSPKHKYCARPQTDHILIVKPNL